MVSSLRFCIHRVLSTFVVSESRPSSENWQPFSSRCVRMAQALDIIGTPVQSTKQDGEDPDERFHRENRELSMHTIFAQQIIDFMGQVIEFGEWIRLRNPDDDEITARLLDSSMPTQDKWHLHPSKARELWFGGRMHYDVLPARQLPHPTDPKQNWHSERVWLFRLKNCRHPRAWWIGIYDPFLVRRLLFHPQVQHQSMEEFLEFLVDQNAHICTPAPANYPALDPQCAAKAGEKAADQRRMRQDTQPPSRDFKKTPFTSRDFATFWHDLPSLMEDESLMRACALQGGWLGRLVGEHINRAVLAKGPTKATLAAPVGKVFRAQDNQHLPNGMVLLDDAAEFQQIALVLGTFVSPSKNETQPNWPRKSFFPPLAVASKTWVLPTWSSADDARFSQVLDDYRNSMAFKQPRSRPEWEKYMKRYTDWARMDFMLGARAACRIFLDAALGVPPPE
jgi:hypothetical protein